MLGKPAIVGCLVFSWLFIIYSELPLAFGEGVSLPCFYLIFFLPILWPIIQGSLKKNHLYFLISLLGVASFSIISKGDIELVLGSVFKLLQFSFSLTICLLSFALFIGIGREQSFSILGIFIIFIVVGCLLERMGLIRPITEAFRVVYSQTKGGGEISSDREIELAGFARPYFFTAEPSLVGLGFFSIASCISFINRQLIVDIFLLLAVPIVLVLLGSPTVILTLIPMSIFMFVKYKISVLKLAYIFGAIALLLGLLWQLPIMKDTIVRVFDRIT